MYPMDPVSVVDFSGQQAVHRPPQRIPRRRRPPNPLPSVQACSGGVKDCFTRGFWETARDILPIAIPGCLPGCATGLYKLGEDVRGTVDSAHFGSEAERNAIRHCLWNCEAVKQLGCKCAQQTDWREVIWDPLKDIGKRFGIGKGAGGDSDLDLHNNRVGRCLGSNASDCANACNNAWEVGLLI